jgi:hypothetical protein
VSSWLGHGSINDQWPVVDVNVGQPTVVYLKLVPDPAGSLALVP